MQSVTVQHLPSTGFLPLDLSHLCLHSHISRVCHGSHLPAIMWRKHRKRATCLSSTLVLLQPSCALDKLTNSHAKDNQPNPRPREGTGKLLQASVDFVPQDQKPVNPTYTGGVEEPRCSPTVPQKLQPNKEALSTAVDKVTMKTVLSSGIFRLVQDCWASGRPGEADLFSLLPNCFMLQSPGPPWQCKSRSAAPVLPVTPTAPGSCNLIAWEVYRSFTLKHKVWYSLKTSYLVHVCDLTEGQASLGRSMFFCIWFLGQEIPGGNIGALIMVKMDK